MRDTVEGVSPAAPTACAGWTAHEIVAHLTAGSKEIADLIEERLRGLPARATQDFEDREKPFRALPDDDLRQQWAIQSRRKEVAVAALAELGDEASFEFTGANLTAAQIAMHSRSEAALHRWDIAGDDPISDSLLAQPELTSHAITVLNDMPILFESCRSRMKRVDGSLHIVLRCEDRPDVLLYSDADGAHFRLDGQVADGDAVVRCDPAERLLTMWGRRSSLRGDDVDADDSTRRLVDAVLWPDAVPWSGH